MFQQKKRVDDLVPWLEGSTYALLEGVRKWEAREEDLEYEGDHALYEKWLTAQKEQVWDATKDWMEAKQLHKSLCHHYYLLCALTPHDSMTEELFLLREPSMDHSTT